MNRLDVALNKYYDNFGENYPLGIQETRTVEEIIEDIEHCIDIERKAEEPSYEADEDY